VLTDGAGAGGGGGGGATAWVFLAASGGCAGVVGVVGATAVLLCAELLEIA